MFFFFACFLFLSSEIDNDGVIEPDTDEPQEMGEFENIEVRRQTFYIYSLWIKHTFAHSNPVIL